jgi:aminoglycoside phosphotransferase (APT) family kinase protein
MQRLPGASLGHEPLTRVQTRSLGAVLRTIYDIPAEEVTAAGIGERAFGPSTLPSALSGWLRETYDVSLCRDPVLVADSVSAALEWLTHPEVLPAPRLIALGIADLNPANIVWDGQTCRLVDFEDGGLTDPAYDLADHVEHIAGRLPGVFSPAELSDAVGLSADERERMRAYRPLWAAFWLAMLLPGNGGFRRNPVGTTETQAAHLLRLLGP